MNGRTIIVLLAQLLLVSNVCADELHATADIEQVAYEYALGQAQAQYDNPQIVVNALDSRLRLQRCGVELDIFSNQVNAGVGKQTIGVTCHSPVAWTVYVPVKVKVFKRVAIAKTALAANHIISKEDLTLQQRDISTLRQGFVSDTKKLIGQQLKYSVAMGVVLSSQTVKTQKLVRRGDMVMLVAEVGQMEVRMQGIALSDATLGQNVKVKNSSSKRVVEGVVEATGIVKVTM